MTEKEIKNDASYKKVMQKIETLMAKGSSNVSKNELSEIRQLAEAAQAYEQQKYVIEMPTTLAGIIELKMYELKLKQKEVADKLHISSAKLSLIMSGKQKPDVKFLKSVCIELNIDGGSLLKAV